MVRAGRKGERQTAALNEGLVIAGWEEVGDLSRIGDREELRELLAEIYPQLSPQVIGNWTGQLWRFREEMTSGDLVVMPVSGRGQRQLAVGVVRGPYHYRATAEPGFRHTRPVEWRRKDLDRDAVQSDLRDSIWDHCSQSSS
jgi:restriction system protein